jgi:hypothetical protein
MGSAETRILCLERFGASCDRNRFPPLAQFHGEIDSHALIHHQA